MNTRTIVMVFISCLFLVALSPVLIIADDASAAGQKVTVSLSPRGTYLLADPFDYGPIGGSDIEDPAIVDLEVNGIIAGMTVKVSFTGEICTGAYWDQEPLVYKNMSEVTLFGVFSSSSQLLPINEQHRVPGAIDYGVPEDSGLTYFQGLSTDIPEDFEIEPGMEVVVPEGTKYLFLCYEDSYYPDNIGSIQVTLEVLEESAPLPWAIIVGILVIIGAVVIIVFYWRKGHRLS